MKYTRMIVIVFLFFLAACAQKVSTDTPAATSSDSPSAAAIETPAPTETAPAISDRTTPQQGLAHPVPYISDIRLYHDIDVFTPADLALGPVAITSTQEDVTEALGEPDRITSDPFHALGMMQTYHYPDCRIDFLLTEDDYILQRCAVTGGDQTTPRGIGIGATVRDTILAYVDRIESVKDNRAIFYRSNAASDSPAAVPPSGVIFAGESGGEWILQFTIPVESNPYAGYTQEQIEDRYTTMYFYILRFTTAYGKVTRIDISLGHYVE